MRWSSVGLVVVMACGPSGGDEEGGSALPQLTEVGPSADSGPEPEPAPWSECGEPTPTEFEVVNVGESTVYVQLTDYPGTTPVELTHEGFLVTPGDCGVCFCEDCPSCVVCAALPSTVLALAPGESHAISWNGRDYPVLAESSPHNLCDSSCNYPCGLGPGAMTAAVVYSDWFSTLFSPNVIQQGILGIDMTEFQHPAGSSPQIGLMAPPDAVEPSMSAAGPDGDIQTPYVVASYNPSDETGGLEIAALYGDSESYKSASYLGVFTAAEVGTHPLMEGLYRNAVVGMQGEVASADATEGSVTIDVLAEDRVEGSFEFTTPEGDWSGTFVAPLRG